MSDELKGGAINMTNRNRNDEVEVEEMEGSSDDMPRNVAVELIKNLPSIVLRSSGIVLDSYIAQEKGGGEIIYEITNQYVAISKWMEFYLLDREYVLLEMHKGWRKKLKVYAERIYSFFLLAQEVKAYLIEHPEFFLAFPSPELTPSPVLWMVLCEAEVCKEKLSSCGYLTNSQSRTGVRQLYNSQKDKYTQLVDAEKILFKARASKIRYKYVLENISTYIAKQDISFRNTHHRKYMNSQKSYYRKLIDIGGSAIFLSGDEVIEQTRGKGKRGEGKKKGFA